MDEQIILKYFTGLSPVQKRQLGQMGDIYTEWNSKINVVSRKDMDNLYEHHVLHSLAIARFLTFRPGTSILDVGTGGGFPGIPLAVLFPQCQFVLIDSIGKKVKVAEAVAESLGLENVETIHCNAKEERRKFDFVVSRAVMQANGLVDLVRKNILLDSSHDIPNGIICLKGGDLDDEASQAMARLGTKRPDYPYLIEPISQWFTEPFFETKQVLYIPVGKAKKR